MRFPYDKLLAGSIPYGLQGIFDSRVGVVYMTPATWSRTGSECNMGRNVTIKVNRGNKKRNISELDGQ